MVMGFLDDVDPVGTSLTADQALNLRRSAEFSVWKDRTVTWSPVDPSKWYYTLTGTDPRLHIQTAFVLVGDVATTPSLTLGVIDLEGDIEYDGATLVAV
jgi:hypothetical protein